jgi:hypothetical protein
MVAVPDCAGKTISLDRTPIITGANSRSGGGRRRRFPGIPASRPVGPENPKNIPSSESWKVTEGRVVSSGGRPATAVLSWNADGEVFPWQDPPKYLLRDRGKMYGEAFTKRVTAVGQT